MLWFDPRDANSLAGRLEELERDYAAIRSAARSQVERLNSRTWADVADEYVAFLTSKPGDTPTRAPWPRPPT